MNLTKAKKLIPVFTVFGAFFLAAYLPLSSADYVTDSKTSRAQPPKSVSVTETASVSSSAQETSAPLTTTDFLGAPIVTQAAPEKKPAAPQPTKVVKLDTDGDGKPDTIITYYDNDGDGKPKPDTAVMTSGMDEDGTPEMTVITVDYNEDGKPDLITTTQDPDEDGKPNEITQVLDFNSDGNQFDDPRHERRRNP